MKEKREALKEIMQKLRCLPEDELQWEIIDELLEHLDAQEQELSRELKRKVG